MPQPRTPVPDAECVWLLATTYINQPRSIALAGNLYRGAMAWRPRALKRKARFPPAGFAQPMLATLTAAIPIAPGWLYQVKHDGYHMQGRRRGQRASDYESNDNSALSDLASALLDLLEVGERICAEDGV